LGKSLRQPPSSSGLSAVAVPYLLGLILVLGGIQFITIGIIADINIRTYLESQNKKTYTVRRVYQGKKEEAERDITV